MSVPSAAAAAAIAAVRGVRRSPLVRPHRRSNAALTHRGVRSTRMAVGCGVGARRPASTDREAKEEERPPPRGRRSTACKRSPYVPPLLRNRLDGPFDLRPPFQINGCGSPIHRASSKRRPSSPLKGEEEENKKAQQPANTQTTTHFTPAGVSEEAGRDVQAAFLCASDPIPTPSRLRRARFGGFRAPSRAAEPWNQWLPVHPVPPRLSRALDRGSRWNKAPAAGR